MRKLLNTLYITAPDAYLSKDGLNVVVSVQQKEVFRIPIMNIEGIVTFGYMGASPGLMRLCTDHGVCLTFLSPNGRFISRIQGETKGNVLLRVQQYKDADDAIKTLHVASIFIAGKIQNYRTILRRYLRDYSANESVESAIRELEFAKNKALHCPTIDVLRGIEGGAANTYFGVMDNLIVNQKEQFKFLGRNKRPPRDPVNAMLSFAYTLLATEVTAALETVGFDPYVGFMHSLRPGRTSLALDVMEELRAYMSDRFVLSLINRKQVTGKDFLQQGEDAIMMSEDARKKFLAAWQNRKKEEIEHPFLHEKIPIGLIPHTQAMLLARYIRGDIDDYPVFLIK